MYPQSTESNGGDRKQPWVTLWLESRGKTGWTCISNDDTRLNHLVKRRGGSYGSINLPHPRPNTNQIEITVFTSFTVERFFILMAGTWVFL